MTDIYKFNENLTEINMTPIMITIPKIVNLNSSSAGPSSPDDPIDEFLIRGKKRRLDHLTWEEKFQRKKMKNRVAAQTSRDRKKAKMDDMEFTIKNITEENAALRKEFDVMRADREDLKCRNESLEQKVAELQKRLDETSQQYENELKQRAERSVGCGSITNGSAAGTGTPVDTTFSRPHRFERLNSSLEDCCSMPSLQDMLEEFDASRLEELAESLLADVITDMADDPSSGSSIVAEDAGIQQRLSGCMVGTTAKQLESTQDTVSSLNTPTKRQLRPKTPQTTIQPVAPLAPITPKLEPASDDHETLYGTYDEATNCITICMPDDMTVGASEEIMTCDASLEDDCISNLSLLSPIPTNYPSPGYSSGGSYRCADLKSPISIYSATESGYDSIGSPLGASETDMHFDELWNGSFTELFPSLF